MAYDVNQEVTMHFTGKVIGMFPAGDVLHKVNTYRIESAGTHFNATEPFLDSAIVKEEPKQEAKEVENQRKKNNLLNQKKSMK